MTEDSKLIDGYGGDTAFAKVLNLPAKGGAQRVHNWRSRGIPAQVKLDHPHIFLRRRASKAATKS